MNKILVSACLLGEAVRYDGKHNEQKNSHLDQWVEQCRVISICPEVAGGMTVPRIAAEIQGGDGAAVLEGSAMVCDKVGNDVTQAFISGAQQALTLCKQLGIKVAILACRSPSCGNKIIYDGTFSGTTLSGSGVTASLLQQNGIRVFNQTELDDAAQYVNN